MPEVDKWSELLSSKILDLFPIRTGYVRIAGSLIYYSDSYGLLCFIEDGIAILKNLVTARCILPILIYPYFGQYRKTKRKFAKFIEESVYNLNGFDNLIYNYTRSFKIKPENLSRKIVYIPYYILGNTLDEITVRGIYVKFKFKKPNSKSNNILSKITHKKLVFRIEKSLDPRFRKSKKKDLEIYIRKKISEIDSLKPLAKW